MAFQSIEQIRTALNITARDPEEIRREIRRQLKAAHPDTAAGAGRPAADRQVLQLTEALDFLDEHKRMTAVVPVEDVTSLVHALQHLMPLTRARETENLFSRLVDERIAETKHAGRTARLTLTAVAAVLTALWLFPGLVGSHPVLRGIIRSEDPLFTLIWAALLLCTAAMWLVQKLWRQRAIAAITDLKLDVTQHRLFRAFVQAQADLLQEPLPLRFYRDDFIHYLEGRAGFAAASAGKAAGDARLDTELARHLADTILQNAEHRGMVKKADSQTLRQQYILMVAPYDL
jgi:hypothetical protein